MILTKGYRTGYLNTTLYIPSITQTVPIEKDTLYKFPFWVGHPDSTSNDTVKVIISVDSPGPQWVVFIDPNPVRIPPHDSVMVYLGLVDSEYFDDSTGIDGRPVYVIGNDTIGDTAKIINGAMVHQEYRNGYPSTNWNYRAVENYYGLSLWGNHTISNSIIFMHGNYNFHISKWGGGGSLDRVSLYPDTANPSVSYGVRVDSGGTLTANYLYLYDASAGSMADNGAFETRSDNATLSKSWIHKARNTGIKITKCSPCIEYCYVDSAGCGILIDTASPVLKRITIEDCGIDIKVRRGNVKLVDCIFDTQKVQLGQGDSLSLFHTLHIKVISPSGTPVESANIVIKNTNGDSVSGVTNAYGRIDHELIELLKYGDAGTTKDIYYAPFTVYVEKDSFYGTDTSVSFNNKDLWAILTISPAGAEEKKITANDYKLMLTGTNPSCYEHIFMYTLPKKGDIEINIYNLTGQKVKTLVNKQSEAGVYKSVWDGRNLSGKLCPNGVYFVHMKAGKVSRSLQFVLMKKNM
ncbi:MAG: FlgD immunoglobulin-like domain containing protein [bacterium]|nr:FlgD immunoglobulin-like domain containing protein [bacterium]